MAENQILPFAQGQGANVLDQTTYAGDSMRLQGHQPGVARSALENKALRQSTSMAAGLAQFIADKQSADVTDALTPAEIAGMLADASAGTFTTGVDANGYVKLPAKSGENPLIIQWGHGTTGAQVGASARVNFPISFPNQCFQIVLSYVGDTTTGSYVWLRAFNNDYFLASGSSASAGLRFIAIGN